MFIGWCEWRRHVSPDHNNRRNRRHCRFHSRKSIWQSVRANCAHFNRRCKRANKQKVKTRPTNNNDKESFIRLAIVIVGILAFAISTVVGKTSKCSLAHRYTKDESKRETQMQLTMHPFWRCLIVDSFDNNFQWINQIWTSFPRIILSLCIWSSSSSSSSPTTSSIVFENKITSRACFIVDYFLLPFFFPPVAFLSPLGQIQCNWMRTVV